MTEPFDVTLGFGRGFWPNQALTGDNRVPDTLISGRNVWVEGPGVLRSWGGATALTPAYGNSIMGLLNNKIFTMTTGSACLYRGGAIFFIGTGPLRVGDTSSFVNVGTATGSLMLSLDGTANSAFIAGLDVPNAPFAFIPANATASSTPLVGTYSFKTTLVRISDNAESNGSPASNIITADGTKKVSLSISKGPFTVTGAYKFRIYVSDRGVPEGPWKFLQDAPFDVTTVELAWLDGDRGATTPPIDFDKPPIGTHTFSLGKYVFVAGVGGVGGIHCSAKSKPEAFPPDLLSFLNPNEIPIGIRGRPANGWIFVFCRNSLHSVYLTGDDVEPFATNPIWSDVGIANPNAAAFVGGEFYGYAGGRTGLRTTASRDTAEPDSTFALPVETIMETWNESTVSVGWDEKSNSVMYFAADPADPGNTMILVYMRNQNLWCLPFYLKDAGITGLVTSCVTLQRKLIFAVGTTLYEMTGTSNSIPWNAVPNWNDGSAKGWYKTVTGFTSSFSAGTGTIKTDLLINFDTANIKSTFTETTNPLPVYNKWKKTNVKHAITFTIRYSGMGANQYIYGSQVIGGVSRMRVR